MRNNENTDVQQFMQINRCWHLVCFIFGGIFPLFKCHVESLSISKSRRFCNTLLLLLLTQAVMSQPPLLVVGLIQRKVTLCYINQNTSMQLEVISVLCYGTNNKLRHLPVFSVFYTTLKTKLSESYKRHCFRDIYDQILDCKLTPQCATWLWMCRLTSSWKRFCRFFKARSRFCLTSCSRCSPGGWK